MLSGGFSRNSLRLSLELAELDLEITSKCTFAVLFSVFFFFFFLKRDNVDEFKVRELLHSSSIQLQRPSGDVNTGEAVRCAWRGGAGGAGGGRVSQVSREEEITGKMWRWQQSTRRREGIER